MKGKSHEILTSFMREASPFLYAQLILEIGTQRLDLATPDYDDPALEETLTETISQIRESYQLRLRRMADTRLKRT